jgi:hypothetical protein
MLPGLIPVRQATKLAPAVVQRVTYATTTDTINFAVATTGNLLVVEVCCETNSTGPVTPSGWTAWPPGNLSTGGPTLTIFSKVAIGGETSVTITHGSNGFAAIMREYRSASTLDFGATSVATTASPNPPAVTPAGGSKQYLIVAGVAFPNNSVSAYPTGYVNGLTAVSTGTGLMRVASAEKSIAAASEDPAMFTLGGAVNNGAFTYAVT